MRLDKQGKSLTVKRYDVWVIITMLINTHTHTHTHTHKHVHTRTLDFGRIEPRGILVLNKE